MQIKMRQRANGIDRGEVFKGKIVGATKEILECRLFQEEADTLNDPLFLIERKGKKKQKSFQEGDSVTIVVLGKYPQKNNTYTARFFSGRSGFLRDIDEIAKRRNGFPESYFGDALLQKSTDHPDRRDLCDLPFVTIDGEDARDFDDAIFVEKDSQGYLLSVAIADVCHYVPRAKRRDLESLDSEAARRGNTFYFLTSSLPMLPPLLCDDLCSLRPQEERAAIVCEMRFSLAGEEEKSTFYPARIESKARLSYHFVQKLLLEEDEACMDSLLENPSGEAIARSLHSALSLAKILHEKRVERGSLDIQGYEIGYIVDEHAWLLGMKYEKSNWANRIIEECMIKANEACARFLTENDLPFLYRVHPKPEEGRVEECLHLLSRLENSPLKSGKKNRSRFFNLSRLSALFSQSPYEPLFRRQLLSLLPKALYQRENIGHFGLASSCYCHFTSPIRRYADIICHRAMRLALDISDEAILANKRLDHMASHLNAQERISQENERTLPRLCACFLLSQDRSEHPAMITSIERYGFFVTLLDMPADGLVRFWSSRGDGAEYLRKKGLFLGSRIRVRAFSVDFDRLHIDFDHV